MASLTLKEIYFFKEEKEKKEEKPSQKEKNEELETVSRLSPEDQTLMQDMEQRIENAIIDSVYLEESKKLKGLVLMTEGKNEGGCEYEKKVLDALRAVKISGNLSQGACSDNTMADADMNIFGKVFNLECKLNSSAQMGGGSVRYAPGTIPEIVSKAKDSTDELEPETKALLISTVEGRSKKLDKLLAFIKKQNPKDINSQAVKYPMSCTREAWDKAAAKGLIVKDYPVYDIKFITNHYAKKGIYYIQIGDSGLFYMNKNPAKLPVPKLEGKIAVEVRTGRSGTRILSSGISVIGCGIRAQGRMRGKKPKSPFTLDNPKSIQTMLAQMKNQKPITKRKVR